MEIKCLFAILFVFLAPSVQSFRYLMVAINIGYSHLQFNGRLADILVENGHEVDFIVSRMTSFVEGNGTRLANVFRFTPKSAEEINSLMSQAPLYSDVFENEVEIFSKEVMPLFKRSFELFCSDLMSDIELISYLKSRQYDAAISEQWDTCAQVLFHHLNVRSVMGTIPTPLSDMLAFALNVPGLPSFVPVMNNAPEAPLEMTFWQRAKNFYNYVHTNYFIVPQMNDVFDSAGEFRGNVIPFDYPSISQIKQNVSMIFVNTFENLDLPRLTLSTIRKIGGIVLKEPKKQLTLELAEIYSKAESGVVLMSFGSIVDTTQMKPAIRDALLRSFAKFKDYQFIWKFVGEKTERLESVFDNYTNVHPMEWIDQTTLLANPNTRAFISHVGLNSLNEAAYFGVPVIACPFFGDQTYNTAIVKHVGLGVRLDKRDITEETVTEVLNQVLNQPRYIQRAKQLSRALKAEADGRINRFVRDVEFATQFPEELKRQALPQMNLFFFYSLDVIFAVLFVGLLGLSLIGWLLSFLFRFVRSEKQKTL
ncbi:Glucuronosyltransferase [Aphelenchoides besseyi]|nr:Glucuronosyltransferase [Aphelenchoides besseyi]KAI6217010.1 Glucuronosyltransferase [Aphelenchoides besseyi]